LGVVVDHWTCARTPMTAPRRSARR
jgi:hypothetical protein